MSPTDDLELRQSIQAELEQTRTAFHSLLETLPEADWRLPSANPAWNIGEILYHMAMPLLFIPEEAGLIRSQVPFPAPPLPVFDFFNRAFTHLAARRYNRRTLVDFYDRQHAQVLKALDRVQPGDWEKSAPYPAAHPPLIEGRVTVENLFRLQAVHFHDHLEDVRQGLAALEAPLEPQGSQPTQPPQGSLLGQPPPGWLRVVFKAPLNLFRLGLGPLLAPVMVVISHTGRKSGKTRHTLTEYINLDGVIYVPSGYGPQSDWYRNLQADPHATLQFGWRVQPAVASRLSEPRELLMVLSKAYRREPPLMDHYLAALGIENHPADIVAKRERIHFLRFDPAEQPGPPPIKADLLWVWPVLLGGWLLLRRLQKKSAAKRAAEKKAA